MILSHGLDLYFSEYSLILVCHEKGCQMSGSLYGEHFLDRLSVYFAGIILIQSGVSVFHFVRSGYSATNGICC